MTSTTWTQNAGMDSGTDSDTVLTYAETAEAAATAASASEAAALASENSAEFNATNAASSKVASAASATAAASSATNAATSEANAATSASAAASSASGAAASLSATAADVIESEAAVTSALSQAANAAASATAASASETNASTSETNASTSATGASVSASNADTSEANAAASAVTAAGHETAASTFANNAASSATAAAASVSDISDGVTAADASATAASNSATAAATSATASAYSAASIVGDVADAQSAATQAQGYRDTASLHKLAAEAAATSATNTASALTGFDLAAIAETKSVTAVDVFVYDTSKDSDGGAWRKRTQATSWYNEPLNTATRGSRKEFPAVAVIVAEATKVTIYDGDDPDLPMWMVFNGGSWQNGLPVRLGPGSVSSTSFKNGILLMASKDFTASGLVTVSFLSDSGTIVSGTGFNFRFVVPVNIEQRNDTGTNTPLSGGPILCNASVNDVAMTVLPNAPIDAATGLPVPTIAVATNGGVSVIKDDGTVVDKVATVGSNYNRVFDIAFTENNDITFYYDRGYNKRNMLGVWPILSSDSSAFDFSSDNIWSSAPVGYPSGIGTKSNSSDSFSTIASHRGEIAAGKSIGLSIFDVQGTEDQSAVAYTTSTYNTGWMNGDIKLATLSDTDDTDVVGAELVTNGTFDTDTDWTKGTGWTIGSGVATCDGSQTDYTGLAQTVSLNSSNTYVLTFDLTLTTGSVFVRFGSSSSAGNLSILSSGGTYTYTTPPLGAANTIKFLGNASFAGSIDNISVRLAEADRSVNGNGLQVHGTVTKTPVATGADLVAYSGFSTSNYLEQPYNSDLDFGTGDFCIMGWVELNSTGYGALFHRTAAKSGTNDTGFCLLYFPTGIAFKTGAQAAQTTTYRPTGLTHVCAIREGSVGTLYVNGAVVATNASMTNTVNATDSVLGVGGYWQSGSFIASSNDKFALLRISATAPTASQIAKMYNDEKTLFQENAQATLYGTSDAVTALAHDDTTDLLHVGTSAGRSVFQGLRRVENTTDAVGTAISASNGLVVEE